MTQLVLAPKEELYRNPRRFLSHTILPIEITCNTCTSIFKVDMVTDIVADLDKNASTVLYATCPLCEDKAELTQTLFNVSGREFQKIREYYRSQMTKTAVAKAIWRDQKAPLLFLLFVTFALIFWIVSIYIHGSDAVFAGIVIILTIGIPTLVFLPE